MATIKLEDLINDHGDDEPANVGLQNAKWVKQVSEPLAEFVKEHTEGIGKQIQEAARVAEPPNIEPPRSFIAAQRMTDDLARHQEQMDKIMEAQRREKAEAVEREKRLVALVEQQEKREQERDKQAEDQRRADVEHRSKESRRVLLTLILAALTLIVSVIGLFVGG